MKERIPAVSNHALLCYMERVKGIPVEKYRRQMTQGLRTSGMQQIINWAKCCKIRSPQDNVTYCCRDNTVTTCYPTKPARLIHD